MMPIIIMIDKRMSLLKFLQLLLGLESKLSSSSSALWKNYEKVVGKRLSDTFRSTSTLQSAFELAMSESNTAIQYGCSNYINGSAIADKVRAHTWASTVLPIAVDQENDFMCFMVIQDDHDYEDFTSVFEWLGPALPPLKIHDSIYNLVESTHDNSSWEQSDPMDLTVLYQMQNSNNDDATATLKSIRVHRRLTDLSCYDRSIFQKFYWTNSQHDYSGDVRKAIWTEFSHQLSFKNKNLLRIKEDPCLLVNISAAVHDKRIVIPMGQILALKDRTMAKACIVYLAAIFAQESYVTHIALTTRPELLNYRARSIQQNQIVGIDPDCMPYTTVGLGGDDQIMGIADEGLDIYSCYFYDPRGHVQFSDIQNPVYDTSYRKVVMYSYIPGSSDTSDEAGGHGTHVCGTAVGSLPDDNLLSEGGMYSGIAPNAKIAFLDVGKPGSVLTIPPVRDLYGPAHGVGARVFSNSWGNYFTGSGYYCTHDSDEFLYHNQTSLIFFSAGNQGNNDDGAGTITIDASGKNMIAVGSSETTLDTPNIDYVAWYSSKGPVYDNRIKPDLVAPGDQLLSARASGNGAQTCETVEMTGTSMSAPSAAANALLVRQYFIDSDHSYWTARCNPNYHSCKSMEPSGPLVKAILINSAVNMSLFDGGGAKTVQLGRGPDYMQGFGRINLANVLPVPGLNDFDLFVDDQVNIGQYSQKAYQVIINDVPWMQTPLRITLCWYDPPNQDGVTWNAMLQNLDLTVVSPQGFTYFSNGMNGRDYINTVESVKVENPSNGAWRVFVTSNALPVYGYQLFSLVITSGGTVVYS